MSDNTQGSAWDGVPVAWAAVAQNGQPVCLAYGRADARYHLAEVVPLYRSPTLTDAERKAIELAVKMAGDPSPITAPQVFEYAATLRGLLERTCAT